MNTQESNSNKTKCPDVEDLSFWHDTKEGKDVEEHLDECVECKETIDVYVKIDDLTKKFSLCESDIADKIKSACKEEAEKPYIIFPAHYLKIAVAACFAVFVIVLVHKTVSDSPKVAADNSVTPTEEAAVATTNFIPSSPAGSQQDDLETLNNIEKIDKLLASSNKSAIGSNEIQKVSISGQPSTNNVVYQVKPFVRHVWVCKDLQECESFVKEKVNADLELARKENESEVTYSLRMSDTHLQHLVNDLKAKGYTLVSGDYPQPNQQAHTVLSGQKVNYSLNFVKSTE